MASTNFIARKTVIEADWLNDVNKFVYEDGVTVNQLASPATSLEMSVASYDDLRLALRNTTNNNFYVTGHLVTPGPSGFAGQFVRGTGTAPTDNGGTIIVDATSGAWARRVYTGAIEAEWWGFTGAAIQSAIDFAESLGGGSVHARAGDWPLLTDLIMNSPFVDLFGDDWRTTLVCGPSCANGIDCTSISGTGNVSGYGGIRRLRINQPHTTANFAGILCGPGNLSFEIDRVYLAANAVTSTQAGIRFTNTSTKGAFYTSISKCLIYGFNVGIEAVGTAAQGNSANSIRETHILVASIGVQLGGASGTGCFGWNLDSCWIGSCAVASVRFGPASGSNFVRGLYSENFGSGAQAFIVDAGSRGNYIEVTHAGADGAYTDNGVDTTIFETPAQDGIARSKWTFGKEVRMFLPNTVTLVGSGTEKRYYGQQFSGGYNAFGFGARAYDFGSADLDNPAGFGTMIRQGLSNFKFARYDSGTNPRPDINMLNLEFDGFTFYDGTKIKRIKHGTATLSGGSVVIADSSITANSRIFLTSQSDGGTPGWLRVSARTVGTNFTITSSSGSDTSIIAYMIVEPA